MEDIPNSSNFFATRNPSLSRRRVAVLFVWLGWSVRKCNWTDYEIRSPFAELVLETKSPMLMHGTLAQMEVNAYRILAPLRQAGVGYDAECYGAGCMLLRKNCWEPD